MKKKVLVVLLPVVLLVAGVFGVWANEQTAAQPGCNNCVKMEKVTPCPNCPKSARMEQGVFCPDCPKAARMKQGTPCGNCPKGLDAQSGQPCPKGAGMPAGCANCAKKDAAAPATGGCNKCVKLQQPAEQPVRKGCCNKPQQL